VPVCFAISGNALYVAIDEKPKRRPVTALKRLRNIAENPAVAVIVDRYAEDWARLGWVMLRGRAEVLREARNTGMRRRCCAPATRNSRHADCRLSRHRGAHRAGDELGQSHSRRRPKLKRERRRFPRTGSRRRLDVAWRLAMASRVSTTSDADPCYRLVCGAAGAARRNFCEPPCVLAPFIFPRLRHRHR
jgi:hypothetical protein